VLVEHFAVDGRVFDSLPAMTLGAVAGEAVSWRISARIAESTVFRSRMWAERAGNFQQNETPPSAKMSHPPRKRSVPAGAQPFCDLSLSPKAYALALSLNRAETYVAP
jgi:hypothetical protein